MCARLNEASLIVVQRLEAMMTGCDSNIDQQREDVKQVLLDSTTLSNKDTVQKLANFFTTKYPSNKFWLAMVWNPISGDDVQAVPLTLVQIQVGNKNAAVLWRLKSEVPQVTIKEFLEKFKIPRYCTRNGCVEWSEPRRLFDIIAKDFRNRASFAVIKNLNDLWVYSQGVNYSLTKHKSVNILFVP